MGVNLVPRKSRGCGREPVLHEVGTERLSAAQIAKRTGLSENSVRCRIANGARGDALMAPAKLGGARPARRGATYRERSQTGSSIEFACRLAVRFGRTIPTVEQLQHEFGMHRATAYRWLRAWRAAVGAP